jgi:hypothetical protein
VIQKLKSEGQAVVLISAFDNGNQAVNYCEHTSLPHQQELRSMKQAYDSLRFHYQGDEAVLTLDPSRLVPLYAASVSLDRG